MDVFEKDPRPSEIFGRTGNEIRYTFHFRIVDAVEFGVAHWRHYLHNIHLFRNNKEQSTIDDDQTPNMLENIHLFHVSDLILLKLAQRRRCAREHSALGAHGERHVRDWFRKKNLCKEWFQGYNWPILVCRQSSRSTCHCPGWRVFSNGVFGFCPMLTFFAIINYFIK